MKKFLFNFLIFGFGLIGISYTADILISKSLKHCSHNMFATWNDIYSSKIDGDVVIIGSSRGGVQYSPQILDSILKIDSYNLSLNGRPIDSQILIYNTYRRFNPKPKLIIQNIDFLTINIKINYMRDQFFPYFSDDSLRTAISKSEKYNILELYLPMFRYLGYTELIHTGIYNISNIFKENKPKKFSTNKGFRGTELFWDGSRIPEIQVKYSKDSLALSLFDNYLSKMNSENIKVVFVYAPIYIRVTELIKDIDRMYQMFDTIAKKYNIPILDYNYDPICYDTSYFYNGTHLNKKGAELFSIKLSHDIDSLGIIKQLDFNKK